MKVDLRSFPFSCRGSYMVLSEAEQNWNGLKNEAGLYLRTVHSSAGTPFVARFQIKLQHEKERCHTEIQEAALILKQGEAEIECCFDAPDTLLIRGNAVTELTLDFLTGTGFYDYIYSFAREGRSFYMANCFKNNCRYLIHAEYGESVLDQVWQESSSLHSRLSFRGSEGFLIVLKEIETEWDGRWKKYDFEESRQIMADDLRAFQLRMPLCPPVYEGTAEKASYLLWASIVRKDGFLPRDAMLMSKNWMKSVWSWDHCFNAIALSYQAPDMAWDQFMLMFDCQDPTGLLPDSINDVHVVWNYCKPPIHGWALRWMMRNMTLTGEQMAEAYERLSGWTGWWLEYRDYDGDGLYEYNHGNDSGWDNSTAFSVLPPIATPELQAFLIIQMDVLSDLAERLGMQIEATEWKKKSEQLLQRLIQFMFRKDLPVVLRSGSHEIVSNASLLPYICIVLGKKLPEEIRASMLKVLKSDRFRTAKGYATESPQSPHYRSDGYWRGPIWAPSTMLLMDGMACCGEMETVRQTVGAFAEMAAASGFAENYDAITGEGLRDRSYTWTASAYLAMVHEYLSAKDSDTLLKSAMV